MQSPNPTGRLDGIQWLRAVAAALVVVEHTKNAISTDYLKLAPAVSPLSVFPFSAGVDIFFVISGFVMAYASAPLFGRAGARRTFLLRRAARIAPLYWLTTTFMLAVFAALGSRAWSEVSWSYVIASYLFLPALNADGEPFPLFVIGWTLNYEMAFYAVFALFLGFPRHRALWLTATAVTAAAAWGLVGAPQSIALSFWTDPIILEFVAGIALFGLYQKGALQMPAAARLALALGALVLLALHPAYPGPWRVLIWGIPAVLVVAAALGAGASPSGAERSRADWAGDLSYAVYLAHLPIVLIGAHVLRRLPAEGWLWLGVFPTLVAVGTIAAAWLLHLTIERPILEAARRFSKRWDRR